jgi:GDPmannose 4,6-dehydratase
LDLPIEWSGSGVKEVGIDKEGRELIRIDPTYFRPTEVPFLLGDASKAKNVLGWSPKYDYESLVNDMVDHELKSLK